MERHRRRSRIYTIATHSGITLGPLLGRLAAQEMITGKLWDAWQTSARNACSTAPTCQPCNPAVSLASK